MYMSPLLKMDNMVTFLVRDFLRKELDAIDEIGERSRKEIFLSAFGGSIASLFGSICSGNLDGEIVHITQTLSEREPLNDKYKQLISIDCELKDTIEKIDILVEEERTIDALKRNTSFMRIAHLFYDFYSANMEAMTAKVTIQNIGLSRLASFRENLKKQGKVVPKDFREKYTKLKYSVQTCNDDLKELKQFMRVLNSVLGKSNSPVRD
jgi:hypothetical protein